MPSLGHLIERWLGLLCYIAVMLKAFRYLAALIAALVFVLGLGWILSTSTSFQDCIKNQTEAKSEHAKLSLAITDNATIRMRCAGHVAYEYRDFITAAATVLIALFTFTLWWSTRGMLQATNETIRLARDEFISTHRPKMIVRQFQLDPFKRDTVLSSSCSVINIGSTEGILRYVAAELALWNGRVWEPPGLATVVNPYGPRTIRNGERIPVTIQSRFNITDAQIRAVRQGDLIICAVGEFTYTDQLGTKRRTGFCRNYDVSTHMFVASKNEEYEYQD